MKTKKIIMGAMVAASLCGTGAMAQINYHNGDMLAGFRTTGSSTEVIVDLGSISLYQSGAAVAPNSGVASALSATFGGVSGVYWSVFGYNNSAVAGSPNDPLVSQGDPNTLWLTLARNNPAVQTSNPGVLANSDSQQNVAFDIKQIALTISQGTGVSAGIVAVPTSANGLSHEMNTFGDNEGNFQGDWSFGVENIGAGVSDLYQFDPDPQTSYLGNFALDSGGDLTFTAVPEPSTIAMMGVGLMTLLAVRRSRNK